MICRIIPKKCIACGLCQIKAPLFFDYYDDGIVKFVESDKKSHILSSPIPQNLLDAYRKCPTQAILIEKK